MAPKAISPSALLINLYRFGKQNQPNFVVGYVSKANTSKGSVALPLNSVTRRPARATAVVQRFRQAEVRLMFETTSLDTMNPGN